MEENEVPSVESVAADFKRFCEPQMGCQGCQIFDEDGEIPCAVRFTHTIMCGGKIAKPVKPAESKIPSWCKAGAWVTDGDVTPYGSILVYCVEATIGNVAQVANYGVTDRKPIPSLKPVKFRPYTFEEAKGLLGKVVEWSYASGTKCASLIHGVEDDCIEVKINGVSYETWQRWGATIDGVPIGVPEIDEGGAE